MVQANSIIWDSPKFNINNSSLAINPNYITIPSNSNSKPEHLLDLADENIVLIYYYHFIPKSLGSWIVIHIIPLIKKSKISWTQLIFKSNKGKDPNEYLENLKVFIIENRRAEGLSDTIMKIAFCIELVKNNKTYKWYYSLEKSIRNN